MITPARWEALATQCDVRPRFLGNLIRETAIALQERIAPEREAFEAGYGAYPALQRVERIVTTQCRRIAKE